ncbi:hypothetical protein H4R33_005362 [Dimargaris cristalligena]|nr:hypothetical protein H4R33_005362 [Dimargaris cristalligena]
MNNTAVVRPRRPLQIHVISEEPLKTEEACLGLSRFLKQETAVYLAPPAIVHQLKEVEKALNPSDSVEDDSMKEE